METMTPETQGIVELIFDAAESSEGLQPVLERLSEILRADAAHALLLQKGQLAESYFCGGNRSGFEDYERNWQHKDPRFSVAVRSVGRVFSDVDVIDPVLFEASELYNDQLRKSGLRYTLFGSANVESDLLFAPAFMRAPNAGPFEKEHVRHVAALMPHLCRALRLRHLIGTLRTEIHDMRRALDAVPGAAAILDGAGRLICGNAAIEQLMEAGEGVRLEGRTLSATLAADAKRLAQALMETARFAEAGSKGRAPPQGPLFVQLRRESKRPLAVVLIPLRASSELRCVADRTARIMAVFHDPDFVLRLDPKRVAQAHGLTETEALLATALASGDSLAEFAEARGCSEQTARTHLKRVLDKTGVHRQPELVRVLLGSAALHLARP